MKNKGGFYLKNGVGRHLIAEFFGVKNILSKKEVKKVLVEAAKIMGAKVVKIFVHQFSPQGLTAIAIISESHLAIHDWPELNYVAVDIFTCGQANPYLALEILKEKYLPKKAKIKEIKRGK